MEDSISTDTVIFMEASGQHVADINVVPKPFYIRFLAFLQMCLKVNDNKSHFEQCLSIISFVRQSVNCVYMASRRCCIRQKDAAMEIQFHESHR